MREKALTNGCSATLPALRSFSIRARYYGLGAFVTCVPPVRALAMPLNRGVRLLICLSLTLEVLCITIRSREVLHDEKKRALING